MTIMAMIKSGMACFFPPEPELCAVVGDGTGTAVGTGVGLIVVGLIVVGIVVGIWLDDGAGVGVSIGVGVGSGVGAGIGSGVGVCDGVAVGSGVGVWEGAGVGENVLAATELTETDDMSDRRRAPRSSRLLAAVRRLLPSSLSATSMMLRSSTVAFSLERTNAWMESNPASKAMTSGIVTSV